MVSPVLLVEDDAAVRDRLSHDLRGPHQQLAVVAVNSIDLAIEKLSDPAASWTAVATDMLLPEPQGGHPELAEFASFAPNGWKLARWARDRRPDLPALGLTGEMARIPPECRRWFRKNGDPSREVGVYDKQQQWVLLRHHLLKLAGKNPQVSVFLVHGHDHVTLKELEAYAREDLGWDVQILGEVQRHGRTWIELFENEVDQASLAWILFTPDEWGAPLHPGAVPEHRARPNVVLECGYFYGAYGRSSCRVLVFKKGDLVLPSDLDGIARSVHIKTTVKAADAEIRREIAPWL